MRSYGGVQQTNPGATVLRSYLHLDQWQDGTPLPQAWLDNLSTGLAAVRAAGLKIILRPAYLWGTPNTTAVTESTLLSHMAQLYPIISANSDIVLSLQAGWLGEYGEWHHSNINYTDGTDRASADSRYRILKAILDATPSTLPLEIRTPIFLREFLSLPALAGSPSLTQADRDGLSTLLKYALGLAPSANVTAGLPTLTKSGGNWVYTFTKPAAVSAAAIAVHFSSDLSVWTTAGVTLTMTGSDGTTETWQATTPAASAPKAFFRLQITPP